MKWGMSVGVKQKIEEKSKILYWVKVLMPFINQEKDTLMIVLAKC